MTQNVGRALRQLWEDNYCVYGARNLWKTARRAGHDVGRDQVARLMRSAGIEGVRRGKRVRTTKAGPGAPRHPDLVKRRFHRHRTQPVVGDRADIRTDLGRDSVCVLHRRCLLPDDRRLAGGLAHAYHDGPRRTRNGPLVAGKFIARLDLSLRCRLAIHLHPLRRAPRRDGAAPSIGSVGDSYDNALAETVNGYYKAELIYGPARTGPWKNIDDVELATLGWVYWHNASRLHIYLGDLPPAEYEATFYATQRSDQALGRNPIARASGKPGRFNWRM